MIVVSDTSPVANLILIKRLDILQILFNNVIIPPAVHSEIKALENLGINLNAYNDCNWISVKTPAHIKMVAALKTKLDDGEAELLW